MMRFLIAITTMSALLVGAPLGGARADDDDDDDRWEKREEWLEKQHERAKKDREKWYEAQRKHAERHREWWKEDRERHKEWQEDRREAYEDWLEDERERREKWEKDFHKFQRKHPGYVPYRSPYYSPRGWGYGPPPYSIDHYRPYPRPYGRGI